MIIPIHPGRSEKQQLWHQIILPISMAVICFAFTLTFFALCSSGSWSSQLNILCKPDGSVEVPWASRDQTPEYLPIYYTVRYLQAWDPSLFLNVIFGMGEFTFSQAKAIDFCWDLIVGRGGQFLLGYFVYGVVRRSLVLTMESHDLALPTITSIWMEHGGPRTLWSILHCSRNALGPCRRLIKWRVGAMTFASCYILLFASLVSLMTGYQANLKAYLPDPGTSSLVDASKLYIPDLVVMDGSRIGEHDNYATDAYVGGTHNYRAPTTPMKDYFDMCIDVTWSLIRNTSQLTDGGRAHCPDDTCSFANETTGGNVIWAAANTIMWNNKTWNLDRSLDILSQYHGPHYGYDPWYRDIVMSKNRPLVLADYPIQMRFALGHTTIDIDWVRDNAVCQTLSTYQWGFSSLLLFTFCVLTTFFTTALAFLQWDIYWHSRVNRAGSEPCIYHDVLALADELRRALAGTSNKWPNMDGDELKVSIANVHTRVDAGELPMARSEERQMRRRRNRKLLSPWQYWTPFSV